MPEKLVPLLKDGRLLDIAVAPSDFFRTRLSRKDDAPVGSTDRDAMETYAAAGYRLADRYEDGSEYDGPKTLRAYESEQAERKAARAAEAKPAAPPAKAEAKKD